MSERLPTILIDVTPGPDGEFDQSFLERVGHEVLVCHGPDEGHLCPVLSRAGCDLVSRAHGIVFALDLDRPQHRAILRRYGEITADDVPIRIVIRPGQAEAYAGLLERFEVWEHEPTVAELDGFAAEVEATQRFAD